MNEFIAAEEVSVGTVWGPCTGNGKSLQCKCKQCIHVDNLIDQGKDPHDEYLLAKDRNFDKVD